MYEDFTSDYCKQVISFNSLLFINPCCLSRNVIDTCTESFYVLTQLLFYPPVDIVISIKLHCVR